MGCIVMLLADLLAPLVLVRCSGDKQVDVTGITADSRKVQPGDLFICLTGLNHDGHAYAAEAVNRGAVAVLAEQELQLDVPVAIVPDTRRAMAIVADRFYQSPTQELTLIGITGTNGKTTTSHLIDRILQSQQKRTGIIGTIHTRIGDQYLELKNTTPDVLELQHSFRKMRDLDTEYAVMEVSSHALDMGRVRGCDFSIAVFTNLTQDHLDYHQTMEQYQYAKSLLFAQLGNIYRQGGGKTAILNADDPVSEQFARVTAAQVITYGIDRPADVRATDIKLSHQGTSFTAHTFQGSMPFSLKLMGKFNVYNALAAIAATLVTGIPLAEIKRALEQVEGVSGRLEPVDEGQSFTVLVDYSHTPDSLENALQTVKEFARGRVFCVVGCGGDRDRGKRPLMAKIATKYADLSVLTSDNPRSEDPGAIIADMISGLEAVRPGSLVTRVDRREAIHYAIGQATAGDVVLIAGKGHETYQTIKGVDYPFDDREVAREALKARLNH